MATSKVIDWEGVERDYRAGIKSLREIAADFKTTHRSISVRAEKEGWTRDLKAKILAKAEALVSKHEVSSEVSTQQLLDTKVSEKENIEVNAVRVAEVRIAHRTNITRVRNLVLRLLEEMEAQTNEPDTFETLRELVVCPPDEEDSKASKERAQKLNEAFDRALSLTGRIKGTKELADTLKTLVALEREAYGLATSADPEDGRGKPIDPMEGARRLAFILHQAAHQPGASHV